MDKAEGRIRTRVRARAFALTAAIAVAACDGSRAPTGPSAAGPSSTYVVSGLVLDPVQRPIADARVEVISGVLFGNVTTTDRDGRFSFSTPVADSQPVTLRITGDGHHPATVPGGRDGFRVTLVPIDLADVRGRYTATFRASVACTQIPETLRTRTYTATISPAGSSRTLVTGELTGAAFQYGYSIFFGVLGSDAFRVFISSYDTFNWWLEDHPLIERLAEGGHLSIFGTATAGVTPDTAITTAFEGTWSYCAASGQPGGTNWPITCTVAEATCQAADHRLTLSR